MHIFIQARIGSSRLPGKILLPFYHNKSILELLIEKLLDLPQTKIILSTSTNKENDKLEKIALKYEIICYRGSENDVLKRFIDTAQYINARKIIRICSDNPFLELNSIKQIIMTSKQETDADYISFQVNSCPAIKTHYGFWCEYVTLATLERIYQYTNEAIYHEHVTNYIYENPSKFNIRWLETSKLLEKKSIRLTIDTKEDFLYTQSIYKEICSNNPCPTIEDIVKYMDEHPYNYDFMQKQIANNQK